MLDKSNVEKIPVVILAGGLGTRIADVKKRIPKGLVKIGKYPIIHHIIKIFKHYGYKKFIICTGYKKNEIKKYFYINKKSLTYKDLDIDSKYNTYKYLGLPPGPICMPDISSIEAVLNFKRHDYLYFVANPNKPGHHSFSRTLKEHNNYRRIYINWIKKIN